MTIVADNPLLAAALDYAGRGWQVFPCSPNDKRPLVDGESAKGAHDGGCWLATTDAAQIEAWWRRWPKAMIGVRMGTGSGAIAFDVDCYKADPKTGELHTFEEWLAAIEAEIGAALPPTLVSETPRGGRHLLYAPPEGFDLAGLGNSRGALPGIVDVRGDGGYIVVGPSVRSGPKAREEGCEGRAYFWLAAAAPIATGPRELFECITRTGKFARMAAPPPPASSAPSLLSSGSAEDEAVRKYGLTALDNAVRSVASAPPGKRNETINNVALGIGHLVGAGALSRVTAHAALYSAAFTWGIDGSDKALKPGGTLDRALDDGARAPSDLGEVRRSARERAERRARYEARGQGGARLAPPEPPAWEPDGVSADSCSDQESPEDEGPTVSPDPYDDRDEAIGDPPALEGEPDWETIEACAKLDVSDTDHGKRLMRHRGTDICSRDQQGGKEPLWCVWTGSYWNDAGGKGPARAIAQTIGDLVKMEALYILPTPEERAAMKAAADAKAAAAGRSSSPDAAEARAIELGEIAEKAVAKRKGNRVTAGQTAKNKGKVDAMLDMAAPHLVRPVEAFNPDPLVLVCETHTLRFVRDSLDGCSDSSVRVEAVEGHRRDDMVTALAPVQWNPGASSPIFGPFLERFMPNRETRRYLQKVCGLGVLGLTAQIFVYHYGSGANGKSVFLEALCRLLGPLGASLPAGAISGEVVGEEVKATPEIARLFATRFVRVAEIEEGVAIRESALKRYTGGEKFPARNLFEGYFEFKPIFVLHGSGNGYPRIVGVDNGIKRRVRVVEWPVQLEEAEMRNFEDIVCELLTDREAIFAWLVEGARLYLEEGLQTPEEVSAATRKLFEANDPVAEFLDQGVEATGNMADTIGAKALYDGFAGYTAGNRSAVNQTRFGLNLKAILKFTEDPSTKTARGSVTKWTGSLGGKPVVKDTGSGMVVYRGLSLRSSVLVGSRDPGWNPDDGR